MMRTPPASQANSWEWADPKKFNRRRYGAEYDLSETQGGDKVIPVLSQPLIECCDLPGRGTDACFPMRIALLILLRALTHDKRRR
jgi:hypothetical protein